ncbi:type II toxin-antitoxin system HicA family toxin [Methanothrix sp.]
MIKNAATTKAAPNTSPGLLLLFYITIGTLPRALEKKGFVLDRIRGSHHVYCHPYLDVTGIHFWPQAQPKSLPAGPIFPRSVWQTTDSRPQSLRI